MKNFNTSHEFSTTTLRQAEYEQLSLKLVGLFREVCSTASKLHHLTITRRDRARWAAMIARFDQHIKEEFERQAVKQ